MGSYTGTVPSMLAGEYLDADKLVEVTNFMTALTSAWTSAAPTWTASAGVPAVGNGTLTGAYRLMGKTVDFRILLTAGTTTTFGTAGALFFWTIPGGGTSTSVFLGTGWFYDSSAGSNYPLGWKIDAAATTIRTWRLDASPAAELLNNAPVVMATSDTISMSGTIEIA